MLYAFASVIFMQCFLRAFYASNITRCHLGSSARTLGNGRNTVSRVPLGTLGLHALFPKKYLSLSLSLISLSLSHHQSLSLIIISLSLSLSISRLFLFVSVCSFSVSINLHQSPSISVYFCYQCNIRPSRIAQLIPQTFSGVTKVKLLRQVILEELFGMENMSLEFCL